MEKIRFRVKEIITDNGSINLRLSLIKNEIGMYRIIAETNEDIEITENMCMSLIMADQMFEKVYKNDVTPVTLRDVLNDFQCV